MKDMLAFLIARDTMHQNQWLAVIEDLGGVNANLPIPNTFPMSEQVREFEYAFVSTNIEQPPAPEARWASGPSIDGQGEFKYVYAAPLGQEPVLGPPDVKGYAQQQQMTGGADKGIIKILKTPFYRNI